MSFNTIYNLKYFIESKIENDPHKNYIGTRYWMMGPYRWTEALKKVEKALKDEEKLMKALDKSAEAIKTHYALKRYKSLGHAC